MTTRATATAVTTSRCVRARRGASVRARSSARWRAEAHAPLEPSRDGRERARALATRVVRGLARGERVRGVRVVPIALETPRELRDAAASGLRVKCHWRARGVPSVENSEGAACELASERRGRRMRCRKSNAFIARLFAMCEEETGGEISLSRFDLFHAHAFVHASSRIGLLFHAKEYPAKDEIGFPVDLGRCQVGSKVPYDENSMRHRNILWLSLGGDASVLAFLDTSTESLRDLLTVPELHTTYEGDFGEVEGDIYYFHALRNRKPSERVFIIPR